MNCPGCGNPEYYDFRSGVGFNQDQLAKDGVCFQWADDRYQCASVQTDERKFRRTFRMRLSNYPMEFIRA